MREQRCSLSIKIHIAGTRLLAPPPCIYKKTLDSISRCMLGCHPFGVDPMAKRIKVWLNFVRAKAGDLITRALAVYKGLKNNPDFPNLPFDIEELRVSADAFIASNTAAMDGNRQARARRDRDRGLR